MKSKRYENGKFYIHRYCIRCCCAIEASVQHNGSKTIIPGQLRWSRLANPFKKEFTRFVDEIRKSCSESECEQIKKRFIDRIGITGISVGTMDPEMYIKRKAWRKIRMEKKLSKIIKDKNSKIKNLIELAKNVRRDLIALRICADEHIIEKTQSCLDTLKQMIEE